MEDWCWRGAADIARAVAAREVSALEVTRAHLARIAAIDGRLGAYLLVDEEGALAQAAAVDERVARGEPPGPLAGVPVGLKDLFVTRGLTTTAGSRILADWVPPYDGTAVARLRQAGAVILGKLNMDEFAMGSSNENSAFKPCRNPWDLARVPGGSSGGSAAAVTAGLCALALGTDTGGSIRQPAALSGCVGLKPTYGRVSRYGVVAFASSLDQVGPLGRTALDCALALEVIAGRDPLDATSIDLPVPRYRDATRAPVSIAGLRIGVPEEFFATGLDPEVGERVRAAIAQLEALGARVVNVSLPYSEHAIATYYLVATAEASSNLARYDGVRYGLRVPGRDLIDTYCKTRAAGFGDEVKRRIMLGTYALRAGYYDAYYLRAQKVRTLIKQDFDRAFTQCDAIATPTSPVPAFRIGERAADPLAMYLADIYTISCNLAGLPGLSVPCGFTREDLPVGLQLLGPPLGEATLLGLAAAYQGATDWHERRPPLA
ncbi:MAG TPA: Asp-tRNA(Asn)/Glu-tRNA(Gln) amidotransferase subunit GatA [Polyangia bacterium]|jgi:aspartyl-tRNA(Asn)/glutamyl-tRNA(Gln) amidotransferase subunit A|nr:Asp-tRNA(Asn)/Glu-tRNA(Gln) amidotransferase subunit GatA [Polyangia bacterium]